MGRAGHQIAIEEVNAGSEVLFANQSDRIASGVGRVYLVSIHVFFAIQRWRDRSVTNCIRFPTDHVAFRHLRDVSTEELSRMARLSVFCQEKFWSAGGECSQLMRRLRHINGIDDIAKILGLEKEWQ